MLSFMYSRKHKILRAARDGDHVTISRLLPRATVEDLRHEGKVTFNIWHIVWIIHFTVRYDVLYLSVNIIQYKLRKSNIQSCQLNLLVYTFLYIFIMFVFDYNAVWQNWADVGIWEWGCNISDCLTAARRGPQPAVHGKETYYTSLSYDWIVVY